MADVVYYQIRNKHIRDIRTMPEGQVPAGIDWVLAEGVKPEDAKANLGVYYDGYAVLPFDAKLCKTEAEAAVITEAAAAAKQAQEAQASAAAAPSQKVLDMVAQIRKDELAKTDTGQALLCVLALLLKDDSYLPS